MAVGKKTGGRQKGTPNKDKQALLAEIQEKYPNYHPVIAMAEVANDLDNDLPLRFQAHKEVAQYITPKLKAVEHSGGDKPMELSITWSDED